MESLILEWSLSVRKPIGRADSHVDCPALVWLGISHFDLALKSGLVRHGPVWDAPLLIRCSHTRHECRLHGTSHQDPVTASSEMGGVAIGGSFTDGRGI